MCRTCARPNQLKSVQLCPLQWRNPLRYLLVWPMVMCPRYLSIDWECWGVRWISYPKWKRQLGEDSTAVAYCTQTQTGVALNDVCAQTTWCVCKGSAIPWATEGKRKGGHAYLCKSSVCVRGNGHALTWSRPDRNMPCAATRHGIMPGWRCVARAGYY